MLSRLPSLRLRAALLLLILVMAACADSGTTASEAVTETPTATAAPSTGAPSPPDTASDTTSPGAAPQDDPTVEDPLVGIVGGGSLEGGCMWLDTEDGSRFELVAAPDSQVAIDPANLVIAGTDGSVIAAAGDTVEVTGQIDPGMVSFCQVGTILLVQDVSAR